MSTLLERYAGKIKGVLSCWDRVVIQGTLPWLCFADGMTRYLAARGIRIFDYPKWAQPLRDRLRDNAEQLAREHGVTIEFVRSSKVRKEARIQEVLAERGRQPGLVHVLSAMEGCRSYRPWHDKATGNTFLKPTTSQCLHYYFYFIDEVLGLCYIRVPTWCPFRLQVYFNGHNYLARKLTDAGIAHQLVDNVFVDIADFEAAQQLADGLNVRQLHDRLQHYARLCCPVIDELDVQYHWSLMQVEYATDIAFEDRQTLEPLYEALVRTAVHAIKADNVAMFLGRKVVHGNYKDELGSDFSTRIQGTRIKHHMGPASIKMYDKHGLVLRIETTANKVSFFKHHRKVEHRDGSSSYKLAQVKKTIYSLHPLRRLLGDANRRYLDFISSFDDPTAGIREVGKIAAPRKDNGRNYKGFNFFAPVDQRLFEAILRGEHTISGFRNRDIRRRLPAMSRYQLSRALKRLRVHGLIKRVGRTYKYYITKRGKRILALGLKLKEMLVIPELAAPTATTG